MLKSNSSLIVGLFMLFLLIFFAFFGKYLPFIDNELKTINHLMTNNSIVIPPFPPSSRFPLGTDSSGRDMLSLIVLGAKDTFLIILLITFIRYMFAIPIAYFYHKKVRAIQIIISSLNGLISYIPTIIVMILLITIPPFLEVSIRPVLVITILAFIEIGKVTELIKEELDYLETKDFVLGGIAIGISSFRLLRRYYLPFIYSKILQNFVFDLGKVMFLLGQIGFIGVFISQELVQVEPGLFQFVNTSSVWPSFFINAASNLRGPFWIPFFPALAITYTIFSCNLIANGINKKLKKTII